jgi:flagellar protein FlaD
MENSTDIVKLTEIPNDAENIVILMKWLQYLVDNLGKEHVNEALNFYVDVGWISENIKLDLLKYVKGLNKADGEINENDEKKNITITTNEHIQSLLFIQKLKGKNFEDFLRKVDLDMEKFYKTIETHNLH